jgi:uncharacterized protein with HEPN domain
MPPSVEDRLQDILRSTTRIETLVEGLSLDQFSGDEMRRMAAERYLEIICEAARRLPDHVKQEETAIDWRAMVDFGNRLRHAYHATDVTVIWEIIETHLPPLKAFVDRRLRAAGK